MTFTTSYGLEGKLTVLYTVVFLIRNTTKTDEITFSTEYISSNQKERKLASVSSDQSLDLTESRYLR